MKILRAFPALLAILLGIPTVTTAQDAQPTIADIVFSDSDLTTLLQSVILAGAAGDIDFLGAMESQESDLTVFAPTDAAFDALGNQALADAIGDPEGILTDLLAYHILAEGQLASDLVAIGATNTLLGPAVSITVNDAGDVFVNQSKVVMANIQAANGVVHIIDAVLSTNAPAPPPTPPTIAEIAAENPEFSFLVQAVNAASGAGEIDFASALADPEVDLTVFAPTDAAFIALGAELNNALGDPGGLLSDILAYHVLGTSESSAELAGVDSIPTLNGQSLAISINDNGDVSVNDNRIVIADIEAANGIVHVIDAVLIPASDPGPVLQTIAELADDTPELSTLFDALSAASAAGDINFIETLSNPNAQLTVFAPTDAAFDALGDTLTAALADPGGLLSDVLAYHLLSARGSAEQLLAVGDVTTIQGENITITSDADGNVFINESQVILADIEAINGVIHMIDAVLLPTLPEPEPEPEPPTITEILNTTTNLTTLMQALVLATEIGDVNFTGVFSDPNRSFTVFAPTDAAFEALGEPLQDILADPAGALTQVLVYHAINPVLTASNLAMNSTITTALGQPLTITATPEGTIRVNDSQIIIADIQAANGIVHIIDAVLIPEFPEPAPDPNPPTIADLLVNTPELSTLLQAMTAASGVGNTDFLAVASDTNLELTVFAPTDAAFAALGDDLTEVLDDPAGELSRLLAYHVVGGEAQTVDDLIGADMITTLLGQGITATSTADGNVLLNESLILSSVATANGIVHIIDAVLLPEPEPEPLPTIAEIVAGTPGFGLLLTTLDLASEFGVIDFNATLSDPTADVTVFAPTDAAFVALGDALGDALADPEALTDILAYHVIAGGQTFNELFAQGTVTTLLGENVSFMAGGEGELYVNGSMITVTNIPAANGIVHIIDAVLLPTPPPPPPEILLEGNVIRLEAKFRGGVLHADPQGDAVLTTEPDAASQWQLQSAGDGLFYLLNRKFNLYLDADDAPQSSNVDIGRRNNNGTIWRFEPLDNGCYLLRSTASDRVLDGDPNVDTSLHPKADDEWRVFLIPEPAPGPGQGPGEPPLSTELEPAPGQSPGTLVRLRSRASGMYLHSDEVGEVGLVNQPTPSGVWALEMGPRAAVYIRNNVYNLYLDADGGRSGYNVDIGRKNNTGTLWRSRRQRNGSHLLRNTAFPRYLNTTPGGMNVDSSPNTGPEDEWIIIPYTPPPAQ